MLDIEAPSLPADLMRRANRDVLSLALMDSRNRSLRWASLHEDVLTQSRWGSGPLSGPQAADPPLWALGHLGWFQEHWISRNLQRDQGERADPNASRLASIDPHADALWDPRRTPADARWQLTSPDLNSIRQYLVDTLETTLELLEKAPDSDDGLYFFRLALFHEDHQNEVFATVSQALGVSAPWLPSLGAFHPRPPLWFPESAWPLGSGPGGFAFDNERPVHVERMPDFEIDAQPVSWEQYIEFVEDGGYDDPIWWSEEGWAWAQREGRRSPRHVDQLRHGVLVHRFGQSVRVPLHQPVMHVCWYEADAWCRWAGRRLPTELEWELAAFEGTPRGFRWGEVWEWTAATFRPYDGFQPGPDLARSASAFGSTKVLRGSSFATHERMRHAKYRHFLRPDRDDHFVGFRSCAA